MSACSKGRRRSAATGPRAGRRGRRRWPLPSAAGSADPLGAFTQLTQADAELDRLLAAVGEEREAAERLSRALDQALFTAQSRVRSVSDLHRHPPRQRRPRGAHPARRGRAPTAGRAGQAVHRSGEAIAHANGAAMLAAQAQTLANTDCRTPSARTPVAAVAAAANMGAMIGGIIIGNILSGGMRGGFGGFGGGGFSTGSFGGSAAAAAMLRRRRPLLTRSCFGGEQTQSRATRRARSGFCVCSRDSAALESDREIVGDRVDRDPLLGHRVALADGDRVVVERVEVEVTQNGVPISSWRR